MKFETYVYKIVLDHQPKFHKDPCKDAHARGVNARTHIKKNLCVRSLGYIVGASPPCVCPFVGSLHAAYSALRHFYYKYRETKSTEN